jgi:hypothetical protein
MKTIKTEVRQLSRVEYDINVWSEDNHVYLTFYPLRYPGEDDYPDSDLSHGFPIVDTSEFYSLKIPSKARGPKFRKALDYLKSMVNYDHVSMPDLYPVELWDDEDGMDWWSTESELSYGPELITEFIAKLPRRSQLERFVYGGN